MLNIYKNKNIRLYVNIYKYLLMFITFWAIKLICLINRIMFLKLINKLFIN
jgi:hypothetical protein